MKVQKPFWAILALFILALSAAVITRSDMYWRVSLLCGLLIITGWIWTRFTLNKVFVTRNTRGERQQFGSVFEEQFEINNYFPMTRAWLEIEDASELPGIRTTRVLSWIKPKSSRKYSAYTLLTRRGEYILSPTVLKSGDPLGIFTNSQIVHSEKKLLVLPYLVNLKVFLSPPGLMLGGESIRRKTPEIQPPRVASVREYTPNDSLNRIHWPTTARKDRFMVKEFEQDPQADHWIILDAQKSVHILQENGVDTNTPGINTTAPLWWLQQLHQEKFSLPNDTFEYGACIAGSIARYLIRSDQVVGFASQGQSRLMLSAERGERQLSKILETIALLKCEGKLPLMALLDSHVLQIPRGSTFIIITPFRLRKTYPIGKLFYPSRNASSGDLD